MFDNVVLVIKLLTIPTLEIEILTLKVTLFDICPTFSWPQKSIQRSLYVLVNEKQISPIP